MSAATLSKAEYLKRYMSGGGADDGKKKKKKEKKAKFTSAGMKIVEDDAFVAVSSTARQRAMESDDEEDEIKIELEIKKKTAGPKFRNAFSAAADDVSKVKAEPASRSPSPAPAKKRARHDSDSDHSPARRPRQRHDSDQSPARGGGGGRAASPPRRRQRHDSDASPPRRRRRHDSDADQSPPRRAGKDNSPPRRRQRHDSDQSPPRGGGGGGRRGGNDSDQSPPRAGRTRRDSDASPPRRPRTGGEEARGRRAVSPARIKEEVDEKEEGAGKQKTLDGKVAGLQNARDLKVESEKLKAREAKMFEEMDADRSGRDAETVRRQKQTGKGRVGQEKPEDKEKKEREAVKQAELQDKYKSWNKGVAQLKDREDRLTEAARVAAEPLARSADNEAMNDHLKSVIHESDPMAALIRKKKRDDTIKTGGVVYPTYGGAWPPNRFSIAPGYRWDGVDRSNGFEGKLAMTANRKRANEAEFYQNLAVYE